jgi:predicted transcriptional regulator of viral defense system
MNKELIKYKTKILNYLDENSYNIFTLDQLRAHFILEFDSIFRALKSLIHEGVILNIHKSLYSRPGFADQNVLAYHLAPKGCIAYWSALHYYGLTDQFPNTVFVQSPTLIKDKKILGTFYKFIKVKPQKITQSEIQGRGNSKFAITSIEKTIVDCFDVMDYSGGWEILINAFNKAKLNNQKLIDACEAVNNISTTKRLGYLIEQLDKKNLKSFINYALTKVNRKYSLLDSSANNEGKYQARWRLRLNVSESEILSSIENLY